MHIDLRLLLLHGATSALRQTYTLEQPYNDPDPAILTLSQSLSSYSSHLEAHLLPPQLQFITSNLDVLANAAFIELVALVPAMDEYGLGRMGLNVVVLQQALKALQGESSLERARVFWQLMKEGEVGLQDRVEGAGFGEQEFRGLEGLMRRR